MAAAEEDRRAQEEAAQGCGCVPAGRPTPIGALGQRLFRDGGQGALNKDPPGLLQTLEYRSLTNSFAKCLWRAQ